MPTVIFCRCAELAFVSLDIFISHALKLLYFY